MNHHAPITRNENWLTTWMSGELLMMNAEKGVYLNLRGTGGRIWEMLEQPQTLTGLCEALAAEYDTTPEMVRGEVAAFLEDLRNNDAIRLDAPTAP